MRVLNKNLPSPLRDMDLGMLLRPNYKGFVERRRAAAAAARRASARQLAGTMLRDLGDGRRHGARGRACPKGLYTGAGIEDYVAEMLADPDRTDDFRMLERELYLTATDLDTTERIVLGDEGWRGRADLARGRRVDGAAARLRAGRDQGPRV